MLDPPILCNKGVYFCDSHSRLLKNKAHFPCSELPPFQENPVNWFNWEVCISPSCTCGHSLYTRYKAEKFVSNGFYSIIC